MITLESAIALAAKAHAGQKDLAGEPYILHPLRVMLKVASEPERIVAILHDVVEDTNHTLDDLRLAGCSPEVVDAVDRLTRREGEDYFDYVARAAEHPLARRVKIADLEDNMEWRRLKGRTDVDRDRLARYAEAYRRLTGRSV